MKISIYQFLYYTAVWIEKNRKKINLKIAVSNATTIIYVGKTKQLLAACI